MGKASRQKRSLRATESPAPEIRPKASPAERLVPFLLAAAGIVAYHNAFNGSFLMDDLTAITRNPTIRSLWPPSAVLSPPPNSPVMGRPFVNLSLAVNYAVSGLDARSYHVVNLAIHLLAAIALFGVVRQTLAAPSLPERYRRNAPWIAAAAALLWVVHPLASESVDYTIQRTELLMGLFFLLTLYCGLRGFSARHPGPWHAAALGAFALGLGSKEVVAMAPLVVVAYDWLFWSRSFKELFRRHRGLYVGFGVVLLLFVLIAGTRLRNTFAARMSPWDYALTQSGVIVHYLRLALWPHPLAADYDGWPIATSILSVLPWLSIVLALLALTAWDFARRRKLAFLGVWFFLILAPTSSFRPLVLEVAAERRMYLPLAAVVVLVVLAGEALLRRFRAPSSVACVLVAVVAIALAIATVRRNDAYRNPLAFWSDVVSKRPDNPRGRMGLGYYLYKEGRPADALVHLAEAVRTHPENADARYSYGVVLASVGKADESIEHYREAVRIDPQHVRAHFNFARALLSRGRREEAIEELEAALRVNPTFSAARRLLKELDRSSAR
jgi:tetratricopeptide (TPR) repeat protein